MTFIIIFWTFNTSMVQITTQLLQYLHLLHYQCFNLQVSQIITISDLVQLPMPGQMTRS